MDNRYLGMHIVSTTDKQIKFVPRKVQTDLSINITDEQENESTAESVTGVNIGNFVKIAPTYTFKEGRFYYIVITGTDEEELYRGKVFCTNQTDFDKFTVNENVYNEYEKADANEYIVI